VAATCFATASMPVGGMNGCVHGPSSEFAISQPSYTFMKICGSDALLRISARVLITRWKDAAPGTGFQTGAPWIGTRIAGVLLMITRGGSFCTATVGETCPDAASDACKRSSVMMRDTLASCACSSTA
jgi:hypothetical protein